MTTSRLALGSVSTLALAALAVGIVPILSNHSWGSAGATPFGAIASFSGNLSTSTPADGDRAQLLKLAALKTAATSADPAIAAAAELATAPLQPPVPESTPAAAAAQLSTPAADATPVQMAAAEPPAPAAAEETIVPMPPTAPARSSVGLVNINTASSDVLDRFPGVGRIGRTIVTHRPYHSVEDLVSKRVLRTSDFQKIRGRVSVD